MNPSLLGALAAAFVAAFWLTSRRRVRPFLRSDDTSAVAALNRAQIALIQGPRPSGTADEVVQPVEPPKTLASAVVLASPGLPELPATGDLRQQLALVRQLDRWFQGSASDRLRAMVLARRWRHRCLLPLLHRGLRDPDPRVMAEAAAAMQAFRGLSQGPSPQDAVRLSAAHSRPRKVLRTR